MAKKRRGDDEPVGGIFYVPSEAEQRRLDQARAEKLYNLVRDGREPWKKLPTYVQERWVRSLRHQLFPSLEHEPWKLTNDESAGILRGNEYALALNREESLDLIAAGHEPQRTAALITVFDEGPTRYVEVITAFCVSDCEGCWNARREQEDHYESHVRPTLSREWIPCFDDPLPSVDEEEPIGRGAKQRQAKRRK